MLNKQTIFKVLLLEAGMEEPEVADVPAFAPMVRRSSIDWEFRTQPQKTNCRARRGGQCIWPRGKVMGGSSTINYMIYLRGGPQDYDDWANLGRETNEFLHFNKYMYCLKNIKITKLAYSSQFFPSINISLILMLIQNVLFKAIPVGHTKMYSLTF